MANADSETYTPFQVWDAPTRWFHWINALAVFGLIVVGLGLFYDDALGLSASGKILVKQVHVLIGYVLTLNFIWSSFGHFSATGMHDGAPSCRLGPVIGANYGVMPMPF